ncbi:MULTISPECIES: hypothetical protein [unclassified Marinobacter]|uniref:hypothetical protein n=1 Tax=unclassified Marinobacter TaxID=83889 RepID=UPI0019085C48|nr:hypothetical protein [Marinobacter sp. 1-4A]MBK1852065.1 hypothetical protein [Marinobacter sp. 1-4A]
MGTEKSDRASWAKDFLRLSPEEVSAKYPDDKEIQGAVAQVILARKAYESKSDTSEDLARIETELMKRIALNLAQGLPILVPNIEEVCTNISR